jgi:hypothetical protein
MSKLQEKMVVVVNFLLKHCHNLELKALNGCKDLVDGSGSSNDSVIKRTMELKDQIHNNYRHTRTT